VVYCPGSHTTENLFSTTQIPSTLDTGCDTQQTFPPFAIMAGLEALCCDQFTLPYSQECVVWAQTPTVVVWEAPVGGVRLVLCERSYPS